MGRRNDYRLTLLFGLFLAATVPIVFKKFLDWTLCLPLIADLNCFAWTAVVESERRMRNNRLTTFFLFVTTGLGGMLITVLSTAWD